MSETETQNLDAEQWAARTLEILAERVIVAREAVVIPSVAPDSIEAELRKGAACIRSLRTRCSLLESQRDELMKRLEGK